MIIFPFPKFKKSANIFAGKIKELKVTNPTFVAPDEGAIARVQKVMDTLNIKDEVTFMKKERTPEGVRSTLYGHVNRNVVIIDDILDTGATMLACCEILRCAGAKNIYIFVTHGLFSSVNNEWKNLFDYNVKKIYCTDSIPQAYNLNLKNLEILSVKPIPREFANYVRKVHQEAKKNKQKEELWKYSSS